MQVAKIYVKCYSTKVIIVNQNSVWLKTQTLKLQVSENILPEFNIGFDKRIPKDVEELRSFVEWVENNYHFPITLWIDFEYNHYLFSRDVRRVGYLFYWAEFFTYPIFDNKDGIPQIRLHVQTEHSTIEEILAFFIEAIIDYYAWLFNEMSEGYKSNEYDSDAVRVEEQETGDCLVAEIDSIVMPPATELNNSYYESTDNDVGIFKDIVQALGAQDHIVHENKSETYEFDAAGLYTNGIRFGFGMNYRSLQAEMDVGDYFSLGCMLQQLVTLTGSNSDYEAELMTLSIDSNGAYTSKLGKPVVAANIGKINDAENAATYKKLTTDTMVLWTQEMEDAETVDELVALIREAGVHVFNVEGNDIRIMTYLMFDDNKTLTDETRQGQADTEILFRGFFVKYDGEMYETSYSLQKSNSATRIFDHYNWEQFGVANKPGATAEELLQGASRLAPAEQ